MGWYLHVVFRLLPPLIVALGLSSHVLAAGLDPPATAPEADEATTESDDAAPTDIPPAESDDDAPAEPPAGSEDATAPPEEADDAPEGQSEASEDPRAAVNKEEEEEPGPRFRL
ncbi:MAG: hypothetical protein QF464_16445, partial [Myxococcota bacterium]|nr:hypothetical protein [Myxococcota bacterium]